MACLNRGPQLGAKTTIYMDHNTGAMHCRDLNVVPLGCAARCVATLPTMLVGESALLVRYPGPKPPTKKLQERSVWGKQTYCRAQEESKTSSEVLPGLKPRAPRLWGSVCGHSTKHIGMTRQ